MCRWKLLNPAKKRFARVVDQPMLEKVAHNSLVRDERHIVGSERLELARERETASVDAVVERFDAEAISRAEELPPLAIPQGKGPHPIEPFDAVLPPMLVRCENHLGIGPRSKAMSVGPELAPELEVVVDLSVME